LDYLTLTRGTLARRADPLHPEESLLLRKPTGAVPHEGGTRFGRDSREYDVLRRWIATGMPGDSPETPVLRRLEVAPLRQVLVEPARQVKLKARAVFSDGQERDVTSLVVFEPSSLKVRV